MKMTNKYDITTISVSNSVKKRLSLKKLKGNFKTWDDFFIDFLKRKKGDSNV